VLREFGKLPRTSPGVYVHADTDAMADEIVRLLDERENVSSQLWDAEQTIAGLRARLAAAERVVDAAKRETSADDAYMEVMELLRDCFQNPDQSLMTRRFAVESERHHARMDRMYAVKSYSAAFAAETTTTTKDTTL